MHTKDILAAALCAAGLDAMADKAATGYYHDYLSPLTFPEMQLNEDLQDACKSTPPGPKCDAINALIHRHRGGDFDASLEEADEWAGSAEGREAFSSLLRGRH